ncbi:MAG TPA: response regulator [Clostridiales bacterium]|nr:response regulator [Clostridiales bacterium]
MLKVFLVEDEIVVREGIKNNVNWSENDFIFSGEASDGELAYPMIKEIKPDIVITDIRMPFMDGLQLSRLLKQEMPWIKIIILSGYEEFDYAKEAIEIGITRYLLKPISSTELMKCMKEVRNVIRKEQEEKQNYEIYKKEIKEYEEDEKRNLFHDIINKTVSPVSLLGRGKKLNIELSSMVYLIILFKMNIAADTIDESHHVVEAKEKLDTLFEENDNIIRFSLLFDEQALLLKGSSIEDIIRVKEDCINKVKEIMESYEGISYFGGAGRSVKRLGDISISFHEACSAFAYRYIWDSNEILDYINISKKQITPIYEDSLNVANITELDRRKVETFLKCGSKVDVSYFVEEYLKSICKENRNSLLFRQYIIMDMYSITAGFSEELGLGVDVIDKPFHDKSQFYGQMPTFEFTREYIEKTFNQVINLRDEIATREYNDMIYKAKSYIDENYMNDDISLNQVASEVYLSPSHFSSVFSHKTGQTFIKYLTDLRMNKAKELLKCSNKRSSEIGFSVGYKDPHYFSFLFRKTQNCTPSQYRNHIKAREDS